MNIKKTGTLRYRSNIVECFFPKPSIQESSRISVKLRERTLTNSPPTIHMYFSDIEYIDPSKYLH